MTLIFIDTYLRMAYYNIVVSRLKNNTLYAWVVKTMFDKDIYNIKEIVSVVHEYSAKPREYPFEVEYSSKKMSSKNELFIYLSGRSVWTIGDTTFELCEGDIVLIPWGISLEKYHVTVTEPVTFVDIYFICDDIDLPQPVLLRKQKDSLSNMFLKIAKLWIFKEDGYYTKSMSILYDIINHIQIAKKTYLPSKHYHFIKPAIAYLEQNFYKADFNYVYLASLSGLSYTYFKKLFIKYYGCSPVKQVTNLRINLAQELIVSNKYKLTEVAQMCGFENVQYFSTTFKRIVGVSPSEYFKSRFREE